jgi:hypothetical protein
LREWTQPRPDPCATVVQAPRLFERHIKSVHRQKCLSSNVRRGYGRKGRNFRIDAKRPAKIGRLTHKMLGIELSKLGTRYIHERRKQTVSSTTMPWRTLGDAAMLRCCFHLSGYRLQLPFRSLLAVETRDATTATTATHTYSSTALIVSPFCT